MILRETASVISVLENFGGAVRITTKHGPAIAYTDIVGTVSVGDTVVINRTANALQLGTGGYDYVMAVTDSRKTAESSGSGHIVKLRYTPSQLAVHTLEELPELASVWEKTLAGFPVVVCQLHSQIAHAAAAVAAIGKRAVYVMTDTAALPYSFSNLAADLKNRQVIASSITSGQAFGGEYESVTVHSALLAAKYYLQADVAIVSQGPGNAGTGTKYGFSGIDQAGLMDIAAALGGEPIAVVRASAADPRERHRGISHHTLTTLRLVHSSCSIPVPAGMIKTDLGFRHKIVDVADYESAFDLLKQLEIHVTTMGRDSMSDRIFFEASAAAGTYAASLGEFK